MVIECKTRLDFVDLMPKNGIVAEIGVRRGSHASVMLEIAKPKMLYLIDCWRYQRDPVYGLDENNEPPRLQRKYYRMVKRKFQACSNVTVIRKFSQEASLQFDDNYFDWVYLDANHAYPAVHADIESWWPKIKSGGFLAGHDYIDEPRRHFGVIKAVDGFIEQSGLSLTYLSQETYKDWAIRKS